MAKLVTAVFNTRSSAMLAIEDLSRHGFAAEDISLLNTDTNAGREFFSDMASKAPEGGVIGTVIGMIVGGLVAALMRLGYIPDTGVGVASLSMIVAVIAGIGAGGLLGLLVGAAIGSSIPEYEMNLYRTDKRHGGILVGAYSHVRREGEVRRLMEAAGGRQLRVKNVPDEALPERTRDMVISDRTT